MRLRSDWTTRAVLGHIAFATILSTGAAARAQEPVNRLFPPMSNPANPGPADTVYYYDPETLMKTPIQEGERRRRVSDLQEILSETDANRLVILTIGDTRTMVPADRLPKVAELMVTNGKATPAEAAAWIEEQESLSRSAIQFLRKDLEALQSVGRTLATPAGGDFFPTPMDWLGVRGMVRGNYRMNCSYDGKDLPELRGPFTIELVGDGTVRGTFEDDRLQFQANGELSYGGNDFASLSGKGQWLGGDPFRWDTRVYREGDKIMMMDNAHLFLSPSTPSAECQPGYLEQTE